MAEDSQQTVRAVVTDSGTPGALAIRTVPAPQCSADQALVRVHAFSLNRGEVRTALAAGEGWRPGWDLAGTVVRAAANGSGPREATRVVGLLPTGAWAELVAVPAISLAEIPVNVGFDEASTLPVAGLTAWHALAKGEPLKDRKVLINGASGGVGTFACQLARRAGARVIAAIRNPQHETLMRKLGADVVSTGPDLSSAAAQAPFDFILESVGGTALAFALTNLAPGGTCVLFGNSLSAEVTFDSSKFRAGGTTLYGLFLGYEFRYETPSKGLARLAKLVGDGVLKPEIEVRESWERIADVARALIERQFTGKAVMRIPA